jgi:CheY-like chemotaxis protein/HPt (histidine-containing phosphotransfer) domain-containing protein
MGGKLELVSEAGVGSVFRFEIPLGQVGDASVSRPSLVGVRAFDVEIAAARASLHEELHLTPPLKILLVEDHPLNQEVMGDMMHTLGYTIDIAVDGLDALRHLATAEYALVLMDCQMPNLDGYEASLRWRAQEQERGLKRTPIVAVTAHVWEEERTKVQNAGMDDFLAKPVQVSTLGAMLQHWLGSSLSSGPPSPLAHSEVPSGERPGLLNPRISRSAAMCELFLEQARADVDFIQEAGLVGDAEALRWRAHRLKGGCITFGADQLGELAGQIESLGMTGLADIGSRAGELEDLFRRTALAVNEDRAHTQGTS